MLTNRRGWTPIPKRKAANLGSSRRLTIAGLPISSGDETHVAFATVASRQVQAVAALAQLAVLRALIAVCGQTQALRRARQHNMNMGVSLKGVRVRPEQKKPSPENPCLHVQRYEPMVL